MLCFFLKNLFFILITGMFICFNINANEKDLFWDLEIGVGVQKSGNESDNALDVNNVPNSSVSTSPHNDSDFISSLGLSYNFNFKNNIRLGIGLDYYLSDIDMGGPTTLDSSGYSQTVQTELKDLYVIYLKPQMIINDNNSIYLKLGYASSDLDYSDSDPEYRSHKKTSLDGYFIGTGFKSLINNNLYGFIEVNYFKFNNDTYGGNYNNGSPINFDVDAKIDAINLKLGLGYQF
jgi:hypothetical protein